MIEKRIIAAMVAVFLLIVPVSVTADGGEDVFAGFYIKNVSITDETLVFDLYYSDTEGLGLASVGIYMEYSDGVSLTDF